MSCTELNQLLLLLSGFSCGLAITVIVTSIFVIRYNLQALVSETFMEFYLECSGRIL